MTETSNDRYFKEFYSSSSVTVVKSVVLLRLLVYVRGSQHRPFAHVTCSWVVVFFIRSLSLDFGTVGSFACIKADLMFLSLLGK